MGSPFNYDDDRPALPGKAPTPPVSGRGSVFDYGAEPINAEFNRPAPETLATNASDVLNAASNTFSAGLTNRLGGLRRWATGEAPDYSTGVDQEVALTAERRRRSPYLSTVGDVAGGTAQAFVPGVGAIGRTTGAALGGALPGLRGTAARIAGYGLEGGVLGAGQAAGHTYTGNPADYAKNALVGGAFGSALGAPFGKFADVAPRSLAKIPDSQELKNYSGGSYRATHNVPIDYHSNQYRAALDALEKRLRGITDPDRSKTVWHALNDARSGRLQADPNAPTVTPKDIDAIRQKLTGVNEPGASQTRQALDAFMQWPGGVATGGKAERDAIALHLSRARGDWRAAKRTQAVEESNQYADDRFNTANSAQNAGNTYRQKLVALLNPKSREGRWYTPDEKADIREVTRGEGMANALRTVGNYARGIGGLAAGGGGIAAALAMGDLTPLLGLAVPAAGSVAKGISNRMTVEHAKRLEEKMAMRSPLYQHRAANAPTVAGPGLGNFAESSRNAITNELLNQLRLRGQMPGAPEQN